MKHIQEYVLLMDDELTSAKDYAEDAIFWKSEGNPGRYKIYMDMANDELKHANQIHTLAVEDVAKLKEKGIKAPERMQEIWDRSHREFVERTAWVKQMLSL